MTREDVLRELELLPVWQLRAPAALLAEVAQKVAKVKTETKIEVTTVKPAVLAMTEASGHVLVSDDKNWAFVLPETLSGEAEALFNNILIALGINKTHTEALSNLDNVKVIVAMGEVMAQQLLNSSDSLEQLRGKLHVFKSIALVVTYHPNDLLHHLANKPKMWDDLCIAKSLVAT